MKKLILSISVLFFVSCVSTQTSWTPSQKAAAARVSVMPDSYKVIFNLRAIVELEATFKKISQNENTWVALPTPAISAKVEVCKFGSDVLRVRSTYDNGSGLYITFSKNGLTFTGSKFDYYNPNSENILVEGVFDGSNVTYKNSHPWVLGSDEVLLSHSWNIIYQLYRDNKISKKKFNRFLYKTN